MKSIGVRCVSLLLALSLAVSFSATAFAAESDESEGNEIEVVEEVVDVHNNHDTPCSEEGEVCEEEEAVLEEGVVEEAVESVEEVIEPIEETPEATAPSPKGVEEPALAGAEIAPQGLGTSKPLGTVPVTVTGRLSVAKHAEAVSYLNEYRKANGLAAVSWDSRLVQYALERAVEAYIAPTHMRASGEMFDFALEWLAFGCSDTKGAIAAWQRSPDHNAGLLSDEIKMVGIGGFVASDGTSYWVMMGADDIDIAYDGLTGDCKSGTISTATSFVVDCGAYTPGTEVNGSSNYIPFRLKFSTPSLNVSGSTSVMSYLSHSNAGQNNKIPDPKYDNDFRVVSGPANASNVNFSVISGNATVSANGVVTSLQTAAQAVKVRCTEYYNYVDVTVNFAATSTVHTHSYVSKVVQPTCTSEGYSASECSCGAQESNPVTTPALGHSNVVVSSVKATCTTASKTTYKCSRCGVSSSVTGSKAAHTYALTKTVKASYKTKGYKLHTCGVCKVTKKTNVVPKKVYVSKIKISKSKITLKGKGKKAKLKASVNANASNKKLKWVSSNRKVATVSSKGVVTVRTNKKAKCTIKVKAVDGSKKVAKCVVYVKRKK